MSEACDVIRGEVCDWWCRTHAVGFNGHQPCPVAAEGARRERAAYMHAAEECAALMRDEGLSGADVVADHLRALAGEPEADHG